MFMHKQLEFDYTISCKIDLVTASNLPKTLYILIKPNIKDDTVICGWYHYIFWLIVNFPKIKFPSSHPFISIRKCFFMVDINSLCICSHFRIVFLFKISILKFLWRLWLVNVSYLSKCCTAKLPQQKGLLICQLKSTKFRIHEVNKWIKHNNAINKVSLQAILEELYKKVLNNEVFAG